MSLYKATLVGKRQPGTESRGRVARARYCESRGGGLGRTVAALPRAATAEVQKAYVQSSIHGACEEGAGETAFIISKLALYPSFFLEATRKRAGEGGLAGLLGFSRDKINCFRAAPPEPIEMWARSTITSQFQQVAIEQERQLAPLSDDLKLAQSGLDSLSFAIIVARLKDSLGIDPFDAAEAVEFPATFGDFVRLYENFAK
jgi:hypothetical protein